MHAIFVAFYFTISTTHYVLHPLLHPVATSDGKHDKEKERKIHCIIIHKEKAFTNSWALIFVPSEESIIFLFLFWYFIDSLCIERFIKYKNNIKKTRNKKERKKLMKTICRRNFWANKSTALRTKTKIKDHERIRIICCVFVFTVNGS